MDICFACSNPSATLPLIVSGLEEKCLEILEKLYPNNLVAPKISLKEVLNRDILKERLNRQDYNYFWNAHIDFLVTDKRKNSKPIVAVEVDGPHHLDPNQRYKDEIKNRICDVGRLPLCRIPFEDLQDDLTESQKMARISERLKPF